MMITIIKSFISSKSYISHKYMNHGINVPIQKCFKCNNLFIRNYSTTPFSKNSLNNEIIFVKKYEDAYFLIKYLN